MKDKLQASVMMYKCMKLLSPDYMSQKFESTNHSYNTINSNNLNIPKFKSNRGQSSFLYKGAKTWNEIPSVVSVLLNKKVYIVFYMPDLFDFNFVLSHFFYYGLNLANFNFYNVICTYSFNIYIYLYHYLFIVNSQGFIEKQCTTE